MLYWPEESTFASIPCFLHILRQPWGRLQKLRDFVESHTKSRKHDAPMATRARRGKQFDDENPGGHEPSWTRWYRNLDSDSGAPIEWLTASEQRAGFVIDGQSSPRGTVVETNPALCRASVPWNSSPSFRATARRRHSSLCWLVRVKLRRRPLDF